MRAPVLALSRAIASARRRARQGGLSHIRNGGATARSRRARLPRRPRDDENSDDEWRAYAGVDDELHVFCKQCAVREFGTGP